MQQSTEASIQAEMQRQLQEATLALEGRDAELLLLRQNVTSSEEAKILLQERELLAQEETLRLQRELEDARIAGEGAAGLQQQILMLQEQLAQANAQQSYDQSLREQGAQTQLTQDLQAAQTALQTSNGQVEALQLKAN